MAHRNWLISDGTLYGPFVEWLREETNVHQAILYTREEAQTRVLSGVNGMFAYRAKAAKTVASETGFVKRSDLLDKETIFNPYSFGQTHHPAPAGPS